MTDVTWCNSHNDWHLMMLSSQWLTSHGAILTITGISWCYFHNHWCHMTVSSQCLTSVDATHAMTDIPWCYPQNASHLMMLSPQLLTSGDAILTWHQMMPSSWWLTLHDTTCIFTMADITWCYLHINWHHMPSSWWLTSHYAIII